MKLVKGICTHNSDEVNPNHFVITVDGHELKQGDYMFNSMFDQVTHLVPKGRTDAVFQNLLSEVNRYKDRFSKVTHSTHCLNCGSYEFSCYDWGYECMDCGHDWKFNAYRALDLRGLKEFPQEYLESLQPCNSIEIEFTEHGLKIKQ